MAAKSQRRRTTKPLKKDKPTSAGALQVLDDTQFSLGYMARHVGGKQGLVDLARICGDAGIKALVAAWDGLTEAKKKVTPLEVVCQQVEVDPNWLWGRINEEASRRGADCAKLIGSVFIPDVFKRTVDFAMTKEGWRDRQAILKAARIIPTQNHSNQFSVLAFGGIVGVPEPEPEEDDVPPPSAPLGLPSIEESNMADPHGVVDVRPEAD